MLKRKFPQSRYFEDFSVGETFYIPSRTIGDAEVTAFRTASGDTHPLHYDTEFARERGFPTVMAHPFQLLLYTTPGASDFSYMIEDTLISFIGQSSSFIKWVFRGDSLYPELKVKRLEPQASGGLVTLGSTVVNQRAELCLEGEMSFLIKRRPPGAG